MHSTRLPTLLGVTAVTAALLAAPVLAGSVSGTIKYDGKVPALKPVAMDADPGCAKKHSTPPANEVLVLGEGSTLANIFVRVTSGLAKKDHPAPAEPVVLDQDGCRYKPHVLGVMVGQKLKILNSDGLLHNVHALPAVNKSFNMAMPASRTEAEAVFTQEEPMFKIKCDVHPWMGAWVSVMSHPFFDVTATDGKFKIDNLPAGTFGIEAWHEKLGTKSSSVTIGADETKTVDFTFSPPAS
jgi:plastocyanin